MVLRSAGFSQLHVAGLRAKATVLAPTFRAPLLASIIAAPRMVAQATMPNLTVLLKAQSPRGGRAGFQD